MNRFAVLVNNYVTRASLKAEHGLSLFIQYKNHSILFDTGQSDILLDNGTFMNIPFKEIDIVVISHNHYDHTGGFKYIPLSEKQPITYIPEESENVTSEVTIVSKTIKISSDLWLIHTVSNDKPDEISLVAGKTLFTGCAHAGVPKIMDEALANGLEIDTVCGGFHTVSPQYVEELEKKLPKYSLKRIVALHCTLANTFDLLKKCAENVHYGAVGNLFTI